MREGREPASSLQPSIDLIGMVLMKIHSWPSCRVQLGSAKGLGFIFLSWKIRQPARLQSFLRRDYISARRSISKLSISKG